ncbi:MAG: hypothetical protein KatS3mg026_1578 [Bacteroidia bacterium]|nr:MAG: hypothetical protein KatS3mg026_1578 [Bacteroidia bacterium]
MQSKGFLLFLGTVALLGTLATVYLPHWSGSLYVLVVVGYFFRGGRGWPWAAGLLMGLLWIALALRWDLPNQGMLAGRVAQLLGTSRPILWLITGLIGFLLGLIGVALGQALAHLLPQTPPRLRRHERET